jgi:hypothetical protein
MDMYLCVWDIDFASTIDFSIGIWKCSVSVVMGIFYGYRPLTAWF